MKDILNQLDKNTLSAFKDKLNALMTPKQQQELIEKVKTKDKEMLINMINQIDVNGLDSQAINRFMNDMDKETLMRKIDNLK